MFLLFYFSRPEAQQSIKVRKESEKRTRLVKDLVKPILISYALDLKQELVSMGFSVYLVITLFHNLYLLIEHVFVSLY